MKRALIALVIVVVIGAGWWAYQRYRAQQQAATEAQQAADAAQQAELENVIWASGKLEPLQWAGLSLAISGPVQVIHVEEGDWVTPGQLLLEVENSRLQSQVAVAEAGVSEARAALAKLTAAPTAAELAAAQANVAAAEANVTLAAGQMLEVQAAVDVAEAQVNEAQRAYAEIASHPTEAERVASVARVAVAKAGVEQAQAAYNIVRGDPQLAARPESMTLRQMTAAYEAAKAEAELTAGGPSPQELAVAAGVINTARATVDVANSKAVGAEAAVKAAMAEQKNAQSTLDQLLAGATAEEIAIAQANVQAAEAGLSSAQAELQQSQLLAPFGGQIGALNLRVGELTTPGQILLQLGDTRQMHIKTTDLRETDVVRVTTGMTVEVTFDALPGEIFQGVVTTIAPVSTTDKGSTNYTINVEIANLDPRLRWGMTAFVNIQAPP